MGIRKSLSGVLILWLAPALFGANYAFVFHSASPTASVYDADTLELRGTPVVGNGARRAFGVPDPANPTQSSKFYVVANNRVVVLNGQPPFASRATLDLGATVPVSPNAAALSPDGQKLLVAAGDTVHIVNTRDAIDSINTSIPLPSTPFGIVIEPNSRHAFVMSTDSTIIRIIELQPAVQLLSLTAALPPGNLPTAIGMAPNGHRVYAAAPGSLYEIDRISYTASSPIPNIFSGAGSFTFDPDPAVSSVVFPTLGTAPILNVAARAVSNNPFTTGGLTINKVVLPGANRAYFLAGLPGRVFQGLLTAGGPVSEVALAEFGTNAVDMEASPEGRWVFVAFASGRLSRLDPAGTSAAAAANTQLPPTSLSLVYAASLQASQLQIYGGNAQTATSGVTLSAPLAVRVLGAGNLPAFNQAVTFASNSSVTIREQTVTTNLAGVAETFVTLNVATPIEVTANLVSGAVPASQTFHLNGGSPNPELDGLRKVSGDRQLVVQNSQFPFPLVVRAINNGLPVASLTISTSFPGSVTCPAQTLTDAKGEAAITCTAGGPVTSSTGADIRFTDGLGRTSDPFNITIVPSTADLPASLESENDAALTGMVREILPNAIRLRAFKSNGQGAGEVGIALNVPEGFDMTFDPRVPVTNSSGAATATVNFGCRAGAGTIRAIGLTQNQPALNINFTINRGPASQMIKRQGDGQSGNPGRLLSGPGQALLARLADSCGNGVGRERVEWRVSPPEAATLENVVTTTNDVGEASALVRLGNRAGSFTVTALAGGFSVTFNLTVNVVASRLALVSGNNQNVVLGQALSQQLIVETQDANGVAAPGVDVNFRVTAGAGTVSPARVTSNAQGRAATTLTAGATLGAITVVAEAVGQSVTFTITTFGRVPVAEAIGFVNGASFRQGWVAGSLGTIFGRALMEGITGVAAADRAPFPTTLRGIRVTVEGAEAPLISLVNQGGQEQINLQVPVNIPSSGTVTVVIFNNGSSATITGVRVLPVLPGIFEFDLGGGRWAAALHADYSVVTPQNPARPGEVILLFLTGLGATTPPFATNVAGPVPAATTVRQPVVGLNGEGVEVLGSFYAPGLYTAYQINFVVGRNVRSGVASLSVVVDGIASQDSRLPVQ